MRILVFSDSHLNLPFDEKKFNFLENLIKRADQVIINGDFWEGMLISFDEFLESSWKSLFPLLKSKKTVYIYGNHDEKKLSDKRASIFSDIQTDKYTLKLKNKILTFQHGDSFAPIKFPWLNKLIGETISKQLVYRLDKLEGHLVKKGIHRNLLTLTGKQLNKKIKKIMKGQLQENEYLVCGHTHFREIDDSNRFFNTGFIKHGLAQYMTIENNQPRLMEEWYH